MLRGKKKLIKKKNTNNTDDKKYIMPGMKHMKQDRRPVDGQDTLQTMQDKKMYQPKKSGIYMDREDGSLPQDRVAKYYQEANPKMEQVTGKQMINELKAAGNFIAGGGPLKSAASSAKAAYKAYFKPTVDKVVKAKEQTFGKNFIEDNIVKPVKSELKTIANKITG